MGRAQNTGTDYHAEASYRLAVEAARREDVRLVFLNQGVNKSSGLKIKPNIQPDTMIITTKDGRFHFIEVASKTDKLEVLKARIDTGRNALPESMRGGLDVVRPQDIMKADEITIDQLINTLINKEKK